MQDADSIHNSSFRIQYFRCSNDCSYDCLLWFVDREKQSDVVCRHDDDTNRSLHEMDWDGTFLLCCTLDMQKMHFSVRVFEQEGTVVFFKRSDYSGCSFLAASRSFIVSDDQMLAGIFVTLYGIFTIWLAIVISLVLLIPFLRLRRENHLLQEQMEAQYLYYTKVLEMQSQLREIRHDLKNRLIAENMLREEARNDRCTD